MTISTTTDRYAYTGNGVTTAFAYSSHFLADGDLVVIVRTIATGVEVTKTLTTHYTVSGAGAASGGTVTMLSAPNALEQLIIYGDPTVSQGMDLVENDALPAETLETSVDRLTLIAQRLKDRMDRAVRLTEGFSDTFDMHLPALLVEDTALVVNSTGDGFDTGPSIADIADAGTNATAAAASAAAAASSASASSGSATASAASAASAAAALASAFYRDAVYKTFADSPVTIAQADNGKLFVFDSSGGAIAVALPAIAGLSLPFNVSAVLRTAGSSVTFTRASTDTIFGATTKVLSAAGTGFQMVADTDKSPDDWSVADFGTVADASVTKVKLATSARDLNVTSTKTTTYAIASADDVIPVDSAGGTFSVTLPAAASNSGKEITIIKTNVENTIVTVDGNASETINGSLTTSLASQNENLTLICDGSNWRIQSRTYPEGVNNAYSLTAPVGSWGTIATSNPRIRRRGEEIVGTFYFAYGTVVNSANNGYVSMPSGYVIKNTAYPSGNSTIVGIAVYLNGGSGSILTAPAMNFLFYDGSTTDKLFMGSIFGGDIASVGKANTGIDYASSKAFMVELWGVAVSTFQGD